MDIVISSVSTVVVSDTTAWLAPDGSQYRYSSAKWVQFIFFRDPNSDTAATIPDIAATIMDIAATILDIAATTPVQVIAMSGVVAAIPGIVATSLG